MTGPVSRLANGPVSDPVTGAMTGRPRAAADDRCGPAPWRPRQ